MDTFSTELVIDILDILIVSYLLYRLAFMTTTPEAEHTLWRQYMREQFPAIVMLPLAGLGALFVTLVLRISSGTVEFKVAGVEFKGGAAPIVFWILCFLVLVVGIKLLWLPM